jgi:hypothetical protein
MSGAAHWVRGTRSDWATLAHIGSAWVEEGAP